MGGDEVMLIGISSITSDVIDALRQQAWKCSPDYCQGENTVPMLDPTLPVRGHQCHRGFSFAH